jgi:type IV pilus assembly protein PilE
MLINRLLRRTAHSSSRGGFTLVELLVVIAIIAILAGVALGPITAGIKKGQQSSGVQTSHSLALAEFQYSTDNNNVYPYATTLSLFVGSMYPTYISDMGMLVANGSSQVKYTGSAAATAVTTANCSYDFSYYSASGTSGGLTSSAPDVTPVVFSGSTAKVSASTTAGTATTATVNVTCPFGVAGMAVCYKDNSATWINAVAATGAVTVNDTSWPGGYGTTSFGTW